MSTLQTPIKPTGQQRLHGVKRSPTTPLTPSFNRQNTRRKLDDPSNKRTLGTLETMISENPDSSISSSSSQGSPKKRHSTADPFSPELLLQYKRNWVLNKRNARLIESVAFLEAERSFTNKAESR